MTLTDNVYAMGVRRGDMDFQRWVNTFIFVNILNGKIGKAYEKVDGQLLEAAAAVLRRPPATSGSPCVLSDPKCDPGFVSGLDSPKTGFHCPVRCSRPDRARRQHAASPWRCPPSPAKAALSSAGAEASMRSGEVKRRTNETDITVRLVLDGTGKAEIATGVGFFDHMLDLFARHALIDLTVSVKGDTRIDDHHSVEYTGIALGEALSQALGDKKGIHRYADVHLPMDETLTRVAVDVSGRPFLLPHRVQGAEDRQLRHRAGARILPGLRDPCRAHPACRDALWRQCHASPRAASRGWRGPCGRRSRSIRAQRRPGALHQGRAVGSVGDGLLHRDDPAAGLRRRPRRGRAGAAAAGALQLAGLPFQRPLAALETALAVDAALRDRLGPAALCRAGAAAARRHRHADPSGDRVLSRTRARTLSSASSPARAGASPTWSRRPTSPAPSAASSSARWTARRGCGPRPGRPPPARRLARRR